MATNRFLAERYPIPVAYPPPPLGHVPILFHHPGYPRRRGILFTLPRVDSTGNTNCPKGVHHGTALLACQIVANNAFEGRLFADRKGQCPVQTPIDGVLEDDDYYFLISQDHRLQYPVIPSFKDWIFPHRQIPDTWFPPTVNPEDHRDSNGSRCVLSNNYEGVKHAHIVPREEVDWFTRENMTELYTGASGIDSGLNRIWLRADLHRIYDSHNFAIVPKREILDPGPGEPQPQRPTYVVHFLGGAVGEFSDMYHNVPAQHIECTSQELHLARFAWAILIRVKGFLLKGHTRTVVRVKGGKQMTETLAGPVLNELYGEGRSVSASLLHPRKRRKAGYGDGDGDKDLEEEEEEEEPHSGNVDDGLLQENGARLIGTDALKPQWTPVPVW